ncbi:MAG: cysteine synthase A [Clostridiales bacterium]|nr:cysteine synthase A [Clostridiales bacterium]
MKIFDRVEDLIGKTPLLEIKNFNNFLGLNAKILAKLEYFNPTGSIKDRTALFMIDKAEKDGLIKKGATIIEPTSGNTGIGLASICASRGYKLILTMPETMSTERIKLIKGYGADVVLTDGKLGMKGAIDKANELKSQINGSFIPSQFDNKANIDAHYFTTGREIYLDTDGKIDMFVAGVGTGGTLSGSAKYLKEQNNNIKVVGVEPKSSPMISLGKSGVHKIQGIGANFVPENYLSEYVDLVEQVSDEDAIYYSKLLAKKQGILVGISSGAALSVAVKMAKKEENKGKTIVVILPDTGERYLSTELFND